MLVSGRNSKETAMENSIGLTVLFMRDYGARTWPMVGADSFMRMETVIKEIGRMIKHMAWENTTIQMELNTMENGILISNMDMGLKNGVTGQFMKGIFTKAKNMAKVSLNGKTVLNMKEIFLKILFKAMVFTNGVIIGFIVGNG